MLQPDLHGNKTFVEQHGGESPSWFAKDDTCGPSLEAAKDDEAQLQEAVLEEATAPKKKPKKSRYELERYASKIAKMGADGKEEFYTHLGRRIRDAGIELPTVTVEYNNINIDADALVGSASIPSLTNVALGILKRAVGLGGLKTSKLQVLKNVSGVLKPGRTTLLVGPPGAGKSVLLQLLAGHFKNTHFCHITGDIKYNGKHKSDFVIQRTAGLVDQYDEHIANLTVHETLDFATACQVGTNVPDQSAAVLRAMKADGRKKIASKGGNRQLINLQAQEGQALTSSLSGQPMADVEEEDRLAAAEAGNAGSAQGIASQKSAIKDALAAPTSSAADQDEELEFEKFLEEIQGTKVRTEVIIRLLGIQNCVDTVVGNAYIRGVSGGERKRVTSAEMLVGPKRIMLMDEISTGLDSATTYSVVDFLCRTTHVMGITTMIGLLQPPPEVYSLFDDVLLLTDGQVCFHGPVTEAIPFFGSLGFECPVRKDPANFLQEVTTPKGQVLFSSDEMKAKKGILTKAEWAARYQAPLDGPAPLGVPEYDPLLEAGQYNSKLMMDVEEISDHFWRETPWGRAMKDQLSHPAQPKNQPNPDALTTHEYALTWHKALKVVLRRQWTLALRDRALVIGRLIQVVIMSLIIGSLFSGIDKTTTGARSFFGVSFLSIMFLAMGAMPQLATTFMNKGVFYKQRNNKFFPVSTYAFAMAFSHMPFGLIETVLYTCIVYFIVGYEKGAGYFFIFYLVCFSLMQVMAAIMRFNACASPNMVVSNSCGALSMLVLIITSGYAIVRTSIPGWWIWAYWISPFAYGLRAVVVNELTSPGWDRLQTGSTETVGVYALKQFGFFTERYWIWIGVGYLWFFWLVLTGLTVLVLKYMDPEKARPSIDDGASAAEQMTMQQRVTKAISLKELGKRLSFKKSTSKKGFEGGLEAGQGLQAGALGARPVVSISSSLPFTPINLVFKDLRYFVDAPSKAKSENQSKGNAAKLELLKGITGYAAPGVLTALMGGSGAGKTTLMDVIAGRKTQGEITGDILVNGYPKDQTTWARVVGYVEQMDIHSPQATVREALTFSARLRLEETVTDAQVKAYVEEVIGIVELQPIQNKLVGMPKVSGLSVEQRKRLTIAVELVANPSVVFMDEPTSGLDARAAAIVMRSVKNVSRNGRTVMVTIHQPSIEIFESFDALCLLQRGGRLTYFGMLGMESCNLIHYLESFQGVTPIKRGHNPATWMLEVTGGATSVHTKAAQQDFPTLYQESALFAENAATVQRLTEEGKAKYQPLALTSLYATSKKTQTLALMKKWSTMYWRSPAYNLTRLVMTTLIALFYGTMYLQKGHLPKTGASVGNVQNIMGVLYSCTTFLGMFNMMGVMPILGYERSVMYRERAASMYSCAPYATAAGFVEIPYLLLQSTIFMPITYWMIGFEANAAKFFFFWLVFLMALAMNTFFGQLLVMVTPSQQLGQLLGSALNLIFQIFNGFMLPYPIIPRGWKWLNRCVPSTWILYALAVNQLGNRQDAVTGFDGNQETIQEFMSSYFGYEYHFRWWAVLIVAAYLVAFRVAAMLALKFISFQRR